MNLCFIMKRPVSPRVDLPAIPEEAVEAVVELLMSRSHSKRRPYAAARFLVLAVKMHERHMPFPDRRQVARHLGIAASSIDGQLSMRQANGDIVVEYDIVPGNVRDRDSSKRRRFLVPSEEIRRAARP